MQRRGHGPTNGGDVRRAAALGLAVTVCLLVTTSNGLPTKVQRHNFGLGELRRSCSVKNIISTSARNIYFVVRHKRRLVDFSTKRPGVSHIDELKAKLQLCCIMIWG
jgi:hypothetical protein